MAGRRRSDRALRSKLRSPGRPPVARQEHRRCFWVLIAAGQSSEDAAIGAGVSAPVGVRWFRKAGGMPPSTLVPSSKPLSGRYLSFAEREELAIQHAQGAGVQQIARRMGRSGSTISRKLRRNAATRGSELDYRAITAQWHAERAARRPKPAKLVLNAMLRTYAQDRLAGMVVAPGRAAIPGPTVPWKGRRHGPRKDRRWASAWSPEQIAHRLRHDSLHDETIRISHEAIYQSLYVQSRGALRRELTACLRTGRALRMPRARGRGRGKSFIVPEIMVSERPAEAADQAVPGHWEGDLILGLESSAIGTLVERTARFTMLLHLPRMAQRGVDARVNNGPALAGHGAEAVRDGIAGAIASLPEQLRRSLTWDQGAEMSQHAQLKIDTGLYRRARCVTRIHFSPTRRRCDSLTAGNWSRRRERGTWHWRSGETGPRLPCVFGRGDLAPCVRHRGPTPSPTLWRACRAPKPLAWPGWSARRCVTRWRATTWKGWAAWVTGPARALASYRSAAGNAAGSDPAWPGPRARRRLELDPRGHRRADRGAVRPPSPCLEPEQDPACPRLLATKDAALASERRPEGPRGLAWKKALPAALATAAGAHPGKRITLFF